MTTHNTRRVLLALVCLAVVACDNKRTVSVEFEMEGEPCTPEEQAHNDAIAKSLQDEADDLNRAMNCTSAWRAYEFNQQMRDLAEESGQKAPAPVAKPAPCDRKVKERPDRGEIIQCGGEIVVRRK